MDDIKHFEKSGGSWMTPNISKNQLLSIASRVGLAKLLWWHDGGDSFLV